MTFDCPWCPEYFRTSQELARHFVEQHTDKGGVDDGFGQYFPFVCPCGKRFLTKNSLTNHLIENHVTDMESYKEHAVTAALTKGVGG